MAREDALLTRLERGTESGRARQDATTVENLDALMASVRFNLTNILNSRHNMSEALPDYGLPALSDFTMSNRNYIVVLQEAIRGAISKFEPRLDRVKVSFHEPDPGKPQRLEFRVDAVLIGRAGQQHRVFYETSLGGNGEFEVKE